LSLEIGVGQRTPKNQLQTSANSNQVYVNLNLMHNFYLNPKNCININYHNFLLKSDDYLINELHRFGGTKSIRGFIENSFQANFLTAIMTEYRYIVSPELYFHTVLDYAYYEDKSTDANGRLLGIGAGVGLATKNGILRLNFVNGNNNGQKTGFSETILSMNYSIQF
jgi:hemolysin activation/secretion protein